MEKFRTLANSEKTIATLGVRWWPQKAKQEGDKMNNKNVLRHGKNEMSAEMLVSMLGAGTVLRLERDVWSMAKGLRQARNKCVPPLLLVSRLLLAFPYIVLMPSCH